jgi:UV DNA damage repair endonuclease
MERLPEAVHRRLTFENDDRIYTPEDLLAVLKLMKDVFRLSAAKSA